MQAVRMEVRGVERSGHHAEMRVRALLLELLSNLRRGFDWKLVVEHDVHHVARFHPEGGADQRSVVCAQAQATTADAHGVGIRVLDAELRLERTVLRYDFRGVLERLATEFRDIDLLV